MRRRRGKHWTVSGIYVRTGNDNGNNNSSNSNAMLMDVPMIEIGRGDCDTAPKIMSKGSN